MTTTASTERGASLPVIRAQHTPGPWRARGAYIFSLPADFNVANLVNLQDEAAPANARLIAAAPEMYEALKLIAEMNAESTSDFRKRSKAEGGGTRQGLTIVAARAALSKIEG